MSRDVFIGFDSAWTDNVRNPGAITALICEGQKPTILHKPRLATFAQAGEFVQEVADGADYLLVAVDQPTVVANEEGCRPVERVAGSLISRLGGGVQPARRSGGGTVMFGDGAPIWNFLHAIDAVQDPWAARAEHRGRFVMEVFPALALPAMIPEIWMRRAAAKYNPAAKRFRPSDWALVCEGLAACAARVGLALVARVASSMADLTSPSKADQDRLDALICLVIAVIWRHGAIADSMLLGDPTSGYIVTPVSDDTRAVLMASAATRSVPIGQTWDAPVETHLAGGPTLPPSPPVALSGPPRPLGTPLATRRQSGPASAAQRPARIGADELRSFLIERAVQRASVTYGEVAAAFGFPWTQGFGASLKAALNAVNAENRRRGEPMLMCLVVNQESRQPGQGFFDLIGEGAAEGDRRRALVARESDRCATWVWD